MKVSVWTVAADDDWGTRATVHVTEKEAYEQWLEWQFPSQADADEERNDRETAKNYIEREDFDGLWEWKGDREFGEPFDTYSIEEHMLEIPDGLNAQKSASPIRHNLRRTA